MAPMSRRTSKAERLSALMLMMTGDTRVPVLFTWAGFFAVRIPLAYLLTGPMMELELIGAWLGRFADLYVRGLCVMLRFTSGRWKGGRV